MNFCCCCLFSFTIYYFAFIEEKKKSEVKIVLYTASLSTLLYCMDIWLKCRKHTLHGVRQRVFDVRLKAFLKSNIHAIQALPNKLCVFFFPFFSAAAAAFFLISVCE